MNLLLLFSICLSTLSAATTDQEQKIVDAESIVWLGLDYGDVQMIGSYGFTDPEAIISGHLLGWNGLFIQEMLPALSASVRKPVEVDLAAVQKRNEGASTDQVRMEVGHKRDSTFTAPKIKRIIKSYEINRSSGVGLVFIMEYLLKDAQEACMSVTFFDIGTREVLLVQQVCEPPSGFGFRNYWFGPVKRAVKSIRCSKSSVTIHN